MSVTAQGVVQGPDGKSRCWWATGGAPEYIAYHDQVWGRPMRDETKLFETLTLESFQSGLSWITILRKQEKRPGMGKCFHDHLRWPNTFFAAQGLFTITAARVLASQSR